MTRAALYIRVSTEEQAREGFSLQAQEGSLRSYARAHDWQVVGPYIDDGYSGRTTKRPQYQAMMKDMPEWDTILVYKMDRIHRNSGNFMAMAELLGKKKKGFASVTESIDTSTAIGRFCIDIITRIAQLESDQTQERTLDGMREKARSTDEILSRPCVGLKTKGGNFVRDAPAVPAVLEAFDRFRSLRNLAGTCRELNDEGFTRPGNQPWTVSSLRNALRNVSLIGTKMWDGHTRTFSHEQVVDVELFADVQTILDRQKIIVAPSRKEPEFLRARQLAIDATRAGRRVQLTHPVRAPR